MPTSCRNVTTPPAPDQRANAPHPPRRNGFHPGGPVTTRHDVGIVPYGPYPPRCILSNNS